mgnify:CR=1 FL=1
MDLETKFNLILKELKNICTQIDKRFEQIEHRLEKLESKFDTFSNKELIFEIQLCRLHDSLDDTITRVSILEKNMAVNS